MKTILAILALLQSASFCSRAAAPQPELYSTDFWEIAGGPPGKITWVEIHNRPEAPASGVAHLCILARKNGAPPWEIEWVRDHVAITTQALQRSVTRPCKTRGAYPERYFEAYHRWLEEQKSGKAPLCTTSLQELLSN